MESAQKEKLQLAANLRVTPQRQCPAQTLRTIVSSTLHKFRHLAQELKWLRGLQRQPHSLLNKLNGDLDWPPRCSKPPLRKNDQDEVLAPPSLVAKKQRAPWSRLHHAARREQKKGMLENCLERNGYGARLDGPGQAEPRGRGPWVSGADAAGT